MCLQANREQGLGRIYRGESAPALLLAEAQAPPVTGREPAEGDAAQQGPAEATCCGDASPIPDVAADAMPLQHKTTCAHNA